MTDATDERQRETRGERTRRLLLDAARVRFARDGYRATSVADISRDAGVGGTTAYAHFEGKDALFLAAVDVDLAALFAEVIEVIADDGDEDRSLFRAVLDLVDHHPLARRLLAGLEPDITERVVDGEPFHDLRRTIAAGLAVAQEEGRARTDIDASLVADGLVSLVVAVVMAAVQIGDRVLDVYGPGLDAVLAAVVAPPEGRPSG